MSKTLTKDGKPTTLVDLNPKIVTTDELYGTRNYDEWRDGLLSKTMRTLAN